MALFVELGGIEPPSNSLRTDPIRPFPLHTYAGVPAGRLLTASGGPRIVFPNRQRSFSPSAVFPAVIPHFCCRAVMDWPRAALLLTMTLHSSEMNQAARVNCSSAILCGAPFSESEQLGSQTRPTVLMSKPVSPVKRYVGAQCTTVRLPRIVHDTAIPSSPPRGYPPSSHRAASRQRLAGRSRRHGWICAVLLVASTSSTWRPRYQGLWSIAGVPQLCLDSAKPCERKQFGAGRGDGSRGVWGCQMFANLTIRHQWPTWSRYLRRALGIQR